MSGIIYEGQRTGLFSGRRNLTPTDKIDDDAREDILRYDAKSPYSLNNSSPKKNMLTKLAKKTNGNGKKPLVLQKK